MPRPVATLVVATEVAKAGPMRLHNGPAGPDTCVRLPAHGHGPALRVFEKICFLAPFLETRAWDVPVPWSGAIPRRSGPQQGFPPCLRATSGIATLLFAAGQRKGGVPRACGKRMSSAATRRHKLLPMRRGASGWWCCVCGPAPPNAGNLISGLDKRPHEMYSFSAFPAPHPSRCPKQRKTVPDVARA